MSPQSEKKKKLLKSSASSLVSRSSVAAYPYTNTRRAPAAIPHEIVRTVDAQPRIPRKEMAEPVSGKFVAKVAVGLGAPDMVTVGTFGTGLG